MKLYQVEIKTDKHTLYMTARGLNKHIVKQDIVKQVRELYGSIVGVNIRIKDMVTRF